MRRVYFLAPVALFALLILAFTIGLQRDPSKLESVLIDKPVPAFALPPVRPGDSGLRTADFSGEPALLNVFASWCVACRVEHPMLMRLKTQGVIIHGLDWKDEPVDGAQWLADHGDPYRLVGNDRTGRTGIDLGVTGAPETFVIDRRGRIRYKHIGPIEPSDWEGKIKPLLDRLRTEP